MSFYTTSNGIKMIKTSLLNWEVHEDRGKLLYVIHIGGLADMWQCSYNPETNITSFTSMHYSNDEVYRFYVDNIEEASKLVLQFAKGMKLISNLENTIYTTIK